MYRRILVPIGYGDASEHGVIEGLRLARLAHAALCFIHVVGESTWRDGDAGFSGTVDEFLELVDRRCSAVVNDARVRAAAAGVDCEVMLCDGAGAEPSTLIESQALAWGAELIVMGARLVGGAGLRPGSVGARILQSSRVPVIAVSARTLAC
jgi:nucleotide-binding universal stress UspA family protein